MLNIDDWALAQGVAFVMLLAGRIDSRIMKDAKKLKMTRRKLVSFMKFLKLTDNGKNVSTHNRKKRHTESGRASWAVFRHLLEVPRLASVYNFCTCRDK